MMPRIPDNITTDQARQFAESVTDFLNEKLHEDIWVEDVTRVELTAGRALVALSNSGETEPHYRKWGKAGHREIEHYHTTNNELDRTFPWIEALGLEKEYVMSITLFGPYLQVVGFIKSGSGPWPTAKVLKHEGGIGFQKYTVDIPIIENGDSK